MKWPKLYLILFFALVVLSYLLLLIPIENLDILSREDGVIESAGAIFYLLACIALFISFLRSEGQGNRLGKIVTSRNMFFLFMALLFFVAMGEEISWGQRIFGWATPDGMMEVNVQGETNLHNLLLINGQNPDGSLKTGLEAMFTSHRMFNMLVIGLILFLPLAYRFWPFARNFMDKIRYPVNPIWMGLMFLGILVFGKLLKSIIDASDIWDHAVSEISESNMALMILLVGIYWFHTTKKTAVEGTI